MNEYEYTNYDVMYEVIDTIIYNYCENNPHLQGMIDMYLMLCWDNDSGTYGIAVINAINILINKLIDEFRTIPLEGINDWYEDYNNRMTIYQNMRREISDFLEEVIDELINQNQRKL